MKLRPMLVSSGPLRPDDDRYAFEVKWDGFRAVIDAAPTGVTVWSRNGHDMTNRYRELQCLRDARLPGASCLRCSPPPSMIDSH